MAGGWSKDGAVQDQIDASVKDAIKQAQDRLPKGDSLTHCEECDAEIPEARRQAIPGVRLCVQCQSELDEQEKKDLDLFNRRGSKDSQLR
jgi:phage/conjugal plasmid C-4 type zinc finger TraR family protein